MKPTVRKVLNIIGIILAAASIILVGVSFFFDNQKILIIALGTVVLSQAFIQGLPRATKKEKQ